MQISEARPVGARTDSRLMRIKLCAETHTKALQRASASHSAADSRCVGEAVWFSVAEKVLSCMQQLTVFRGVAGPA